MASDQLACGATGLTVAKVGEARVMRGVCNDILIAYPAVGTRRLQELAELAIDSRITVGIDSRDAAHQLQAAAHSRGITLDILVDLDVGFFRTGIPQSADAVRLCQTIDSMSHLRFRGLMCFPGHLLPNSDPGLWDRYAEALHSVLDQLKACGIFAETVSGGSTPTATVSHRNPFLNEIRPGTYIYNDWNEVRLGVATLEQCAARVLATVVSVPSHQKFIVDAGSKTLSSDRNCVDDQSGFGRVLEFPEAKISRLSEEHGEVTTPDQNTFAMPRVGDRVWLIPNHICVCVNLQNTFFLMDEGSLTEHPVDARGLLV
jgi:D-serine deaminase-like pyridoxal phosphate-dependent protein